MSGLQRRVLPLADCKVLFLSASMGTIQVRGHGTFHYQPLTWDHYQPLLVYMSDDVARSREWLLDGSFDWTENGGRIVPVYSVGYPDGPRLEVVGAKACAEALRRFYPARDYQSDGATEDAATGQSEAQGSPSKVEPKVVPINGPAYMRERLEQERWEDRT